MMNHYINEYEKLIRSTLQNLGCKKELTDNQLRINGRQPENLKNNISHYGISQLSQFFCSVMHRLIKNKPRDILVYPKFDYKGREIGINKLKEKVIKGEALTPNLSKLIFDVPQSKKNDPLLNEWGIHHFHIPEKDGNQTFVNRTDNLLFAIVTDANFILLDVLPHSNETNTYVPWADTKIIEKVEIYYPYMIKPYFIKSGVPPLTSEQRNILRSKNGNTNIITGGGNEYSSPGLGSMASGLPMDSLIQSDKNICFLATLKEPNITLVFDENYQLKTSDVSNRST